MTKEALKLALEALDNLAAWSDGEVGGHMDEPYSAEVARRTITAIKEALAEPEQPKVRTGNCLRVGVCASEGHKIAPQRTWIGLTDIDYAGLPLEQVGLVRWAEAKLRSKNSG